MWVQPRRAGETLFQSTGHYDAGQKLMQLVVSIKGAKGQRGVRAQLARYAQVHPSTATRWLAGRSQPTIDNMRAIATFLDLDPNFVEALWKQNTVVSTKQDEELFALLAYFQRQNVQVKRNLIEFLNILKKNLEESRDGAVRQR